MNYNPLYIGGIKVLMCPAQLQVVAGSVPAGGTLFEYGMGGSTLWFANEFSDTIDCEEPQGEVFTRRIVSVEHSAGYYHKVSAALALSAPYYKHAKQILRPTTVSRTLIGADPSAENPVGLANYITAPLDLKEKPDTFLIDGVARGACLGFVIANFPNSRIFIHDISDERLEWYSWAFKAFGASLKMIAPDKKEPRYSAMLGEVIPVESWAKGKGIWCYERAARVSKVQE